MRLYRDHFKFIFTAASLSPWGDPKNPQGGYTLKMFFTDATYYLPIPLRFLRSVEISGKSGVGGKAPFEGVPPCCNGRFELFAVGDCIALHLRQSKSSRDHWKRRREKIKKKKMPIFSILTEKKNTLLNKGC